MRTGKHVLRYTIDASLVHKEADVVASYIEMLGGDVFSMVFFVGAIDIYFKVDEGYAFSFEALNEMIGLSK